MKRLIVYTIATALLVFGSLGVTPTQAQSQCAKIQSGNIRTSNGDVITLGFDQWGYNYQAHMFNGLYANFSRPATPVTEGPVTLIMKWSDAWLSNQDCNNDFKLDRGAPDFIDSNLSRGWLTNQMEGDYLGDDTNWHHFTYFCKIVYVGPLTAAQIAGNEPDPWTGGARIWGTFAVIEEINNDPYGGFHGITRDLLANPAGFGFYTN